MRRNYAFEIAFEVVSDNDNVTREELFAGLRKRIASLEANGDEIIEACGAPFDEHDAEDEPLTLSPRQP